MIIVGDHVQSKPFSGRDEPFGNRRFGKMHQTAREGVIGLAGGAAYLSFVAISFDFFLLIIDHRQAEADATIATRVDARLDAKMDVLVVVSFREQQAWHRTPASQNAVFHAPVTWVVRVCLPAGEVLAVEQGDKTIRPPVADSSVSRIQV